MISFSRASLVVSMKLSAIRRAPTRSVSQSASSTAEPSTTPMAGGGRGRAPASSPGVRAGRRGSAANAKRTGSGCEQRKSQRRDQTESGWAQASTAHRGGIPASPGVHRTGRASSRQTRPGRPSRSPAAGRPFAARAAGEPASNPAARELRSRPSKVYHLDVPSATITRAMIPPAAR
jgi:hypothetical protein